MRNKFFWAGLLLLATVLHNCRKNDDTTKITEIGRVPTVNVEAALSGRVWDSSSGIATPVPNATIEVAGQTLTTDAAGRFFVSSRLLDQNGTYVRVHKNGFFSTGAFAYPSLGSTARIEIQIMPRWELISFSASTGESISFGFGQDSADVRIPANSLSTADGQLYTGNVHVYGVYLKPTSPSTFEQMPGDLRAINANQETKVLKTYGMIGLELEADNGQPLNLASGQKATIRMGVPQTLQGSAPSTIPLWHFDLADGYWKEEGSATLNDGIYAGEVSHFSFWNCDVPADYAIVNGRFVNAGGQPLASVHVNAKSEAFGTRTGFTDSNGQFGGLMPANETLDLTAVSTCGNPVYSGEIGEFDANTIVDLGDLVGSAGSALTIQGSVQDCGGNPLANAQVVVSTTAGDSLTVVLSDANGNFFTTLSNCQEFNELRLFVVDNNSPNGSQQLTFSVTNNTLVANGISVCTPLDEYILINFDGQSRNYTNSPDFSPFSSNSWLSAKMPQVINPSSDTIGWNIASLSLALPVGNTADLQSIRFSLNFFDSYGCTYCPVCPCTSNEVVQLSSYPTQPGEYAEGTVTGTTHDPSGNSIPFTATFRIKQ